MAKPKLILIPSNQGSKINTVLPTDGSGDFDFSRASKATVINEYGLIENVDDGVSRLEYPLIDGVVSGCPSLLLEPARTNLVTYSIPIDSAPYYYEVGGVALAPIHTANQGISPDGSLNASKIDFNLNGGTTSSDLSQMAYTSSSLTGDYVSSFYLKSFDSNSYIVTLLDPNGAISQETITPEWQRFTFYNGGGTTSTNLIRIRLRGNENTSNTASLLAWGFQLEEGSYATSYIPTNGTAVTRAAETATGSGDAYTFNDSEGVLFADISALSNDGTNRQISISDGNTSQRIYFGFRTNTNEFILSSRDSSYLIGNVSDVTNFNKYAFQYKSGNFKAFVNGFNYGLNLNGGLLPTGLNTLNFNDGAGGADYYGKTKEIAYYDEVLTDLELETLTSYRSLNELVTELNLKAL